MRDNTGGNAMERSDEQLVTAARADDQRITAEFVDEID
jgi:hypothetical protein